MISTVIFDRDGVLTNFDEKAGAAYFESLLPLSLQQLSVRWHEWGDRLGFPRNKTEEVSFWDSFWNDLCQELHLSPVLKAQLQRIDYSLFLRPYTDAQAALLLARQRGLRVGVLSDLTPASLYDSLVAVGLAPLIDIACTATKTGVVKPAPEAYLSIIRKLGARPEECLLFDDELACVEGARRLGVQAYLVDRSLSQHDIPNGMVKDMSELAVILKKHAHYQLN